MFSSCGKIVLVLIDKANRSVVNQLKGLLFKKGLYRETSELLCAVQSVGRGCHKFKAHKGIFFFFFFAESLQLWSLMKTQIWFFSASQAELLLDLCSKAV